MNLILRGFEPVSAQAPNRFLRGQLGPSTALSTAGMARKRTRFCARRRAPATKRSPRPYAARPRPQNRVRKSLSHCPIPACVPVSAPDVPCARTRFCGARFDMPRIGGAYPILRVPISAKRPVTRRCGQGRTRFCGVACDMARPKRTYFCEAWTALIPATSSGTAIARGRQRWRVLAHETTDARTRLATRTRFCGGVHGGSGDPRDADPIAGQSGVPDSAPEPGQKPSRPYPILRAMPPPHGTKFPACVAGGDIRSVPNSAARQCPGGMRAGVPVSAAAALPG